MHCYVAEILWAGWNSITGTLPSELFELPNIRDIHLAYNYISGSIPENIGQAKSLEALHLFDMENMTGTIPNSLYNLTKLKDLWLYNNQFEGSIRTEIGNLKELVHFSIYSNQFTGTIPSELGRCEKLEWVQFQDNLINGSVPDEVCGLRNKNLFPGDTGKKEVLKADCSPNNVKDAPFIFCAPGCCNCAVYEASATSQKCFLDKSAMANLNELAACVGRIGSPLVCSGFEALFSGNLTAWNGIYASSEDRDPINQLKV
ncbi:hypothetical protein ACHAWO_007133 [Cyclotella atomus]|uniref:Uncharacterized protein n=1 Tax=Cyclotella atomus TaxID=382360 RepID=A0ABD3PRG7_9STRA